MNRKTRDKTAPKYKALDMTEHALKVAIRTIDRHAGEGYAKAHPELISAFMATASMAVPLPCSQADDGTATMWLSVLAFGRQADALAKHQKGELVSVAGNMQISQWTGQNGETRQSWQVIADSVISARTARPGGKKGQQGQATDALNRAKQQTGQHDDPYGDGIPF